MTTETIESTSMRIATDYRSVGGKEFSVEGSDKKFRVPERLEPIYSTTIAEQAEELAKHIEQSFAEQNADVPPEDRPQRIWMQPDIYIDACISDMFFNSQAANACGYYNGSYIGLNEAAELFHKELHATRLKSLVAFFGTRYTVKRIVNDFLERV